MGVRRKGRRVTIREGERIRIGRMRRKGTIKDNRRYGEGEGKGEG